MHVLLSGWYLSQLFCTCIVIQSCILVVVIFICLIKSKWNFSIVTTVVNSIILFVQVLTPESDVGLCLKMSSFQGHLQCVGGMVGVNRAITVHMPTAKKN